MFSQQNFILKPCFEESTLGVALLRLGLSTYLAVVKGGVDPEQLINVNEEGNDWEDTGLVNSAEERTHQKKVDSVFMALGEMLQEDRKDVLLTTT